MRHFLQYRHVYGEAVKSTSPMLPNGEICLDGCKIVKRLLLTVMVYVWAE